MSTRRYQIRSTADIGRTLAEARLHKGLTQQQLADQAGIERTYLARLEAGHTVKQLERFVSLLREVDVDLYAVERPHDATA